MAAVVLLSAGTQRPDTGGGDVTGERGGGDRRGAWGGADLRLLAQGGAESASHGMIAEGRRRASVLSMRATVREGAAAERSDEREFGGGWVA